MYWNNSGLSYHFIIRAARVEKFLWGQWRRYYLKQLSWFLSSWLMKVRKEKKVWILESHFRTRGICVTYRSCNVACCCQSEVLASSPFLVALCTASEGLFVITKNILISERLVCLYVFFVLLYPLVQFTIFEFVRDFRIESQKNLSKNTDFMSLFVCFRPITLPSAKPSFTVPTPKNKLSDNC